MSRNRAAKLLSVTPTPFCAVPVRVDRKESRHGLGAAAKKKRRARYTLEVHIKANKHQIKKAIEAAFGVEGRVGQHDDRQAAQERRSAGMKAGKSGFILVRIKKKAIVRLTKESKQIEVDLNPAVQPRPLLLIKRLR